MHFFRTENLSHLNEQLNIEMTDLLQLTRSVFVSKHRYSNATFVLLLK